MTTHPPPPDDIDVSEDLAVRPSRGKASRFEIRVGDFGWHRNAAMLTKDQARVLRDLLNVFLGE